MRYGIDLGTTYSSISFVDDNGKVQVVEVENFEKVIPSVVKFDGKKFSVGTTVKNEAALNPGSTVEMVKRSMGENTTIRLRDKDFKPEEISAEILRYLVDQANKVLNVNCREVVITVPAYFGERERNATAKAAELAKLKLYKLIDEPTAAAISYQYKNPRLKDKTILIYDLGGGTFDISLLKLYSNGAIKVLRHDGKKYLGGKDWDAILLEYVLQKYSELTNENIYDIYNDPFLMQSMTTNVEKLKRNLSTNPKSTIFVKEEAIEVTRDEFNEVTEGKLEETLFIIDRMFSGMEAEGEEVPTIDEVLLVGGSTYMPQVYEALTLKFAEANIERYLPEEAVSRGAAIYAADLSNITINAFKSYGTLASTEKLRKIYGDTDQDPDPLKHKFLYLHNLIFIHQELPQSVEHTFYTVYENQSKVKVEVVENLSTSEINEQKYFRKHACKIIGTLIYDFGKPVPPETPIKICFKMEDATSLLVTVIDSEGHERQLPINFN